MWWMHRRVATDRLPPGRVVVEFDHTAPEKQQLWMVLDRGEASVCVNHPGFDSDLVVTTSTPALASVFNGYTTMARRGRRRRDQGRRSAVARTALPKWFLWSPFSEQSAAKLKSAASRS